MNHLPTLSVGVARPISVVPMGSGRGLIPAAALSIDDDFGLDFDNEFDRVPGRTCTPCEPDPTCASGESRWCGIPGGIATKDCCPPPPPVCGPCEQTCTRYDGTTYTLPCQPRSTGCCEPVS